MKRRPSSAADDLEDSAEVKLMGFEDGPEEYDFRDDDDDDHGATHRDVDEIVDHLRETLTYDMAMKFIPNRLGVTPKDDEDLELLMEELISEAFNDGYDDWDSYPY